MSQTDVELIAVIVTAVLAFPQFLISILSLRRKWRAEFPRKSLVDLRSEIPWEKINEEEFRKVDRLTHAKIYLIPPDAAAIVGSFFLIGYLGAASIVFVLGLQGYLLTSIGLGFYIVYRQWPFYKVIRFLRRMKAEGKLPPELDGVV